MTISRIATGGVATLVTAALATGCGGSAPAGGDPGGDGEITGELVVFAAASLTESFEKIGEQFETSYPGVTVSVNFAGSATLARQINEGAPADVFASASPDRMQSVTDAGNAAGSPTVFTRNQLVIAVPPGNPAGLTELADLAGPGVKVALCAEQVPCGAAARTALDSAGVDLTPVTLEQDVRATLSKVTLGEVDAALVYRTDVTAATALAAIEFPESASALNDYPIVVLAGAGNPPAAAAFVEFVRSAPGQRALTDAGFQPP
jgi:molybdate transport system substrate-binding protein